MSSTPLEHLISAARGPLGPPVTVNLGVSDGPLSELSAMLGQCNGFYFYDAAVQVFHAGRDGLGPDLASWNHEDTWKDTYGARARGLFCFGQDLVGVQFAIVDNREVVVFDPETTTRTRIGTSLQDWAAWLLDDAAAHTAGPLATAWQRQSGPLEHDQRLMPRRLFTLGGAYALDNLRATDAIEAMRARGPIAQQLHRAPDGAAISFHIRGSR